MDRGRTVRFSGEFTKQPAPTARHGRHVRDGNGAMCVDALADTVPFRGLHKFQLGTVPASVTPPRTWRRAAWFVIASAATALAGLVVIAALVGRSSAQQRTTSLEHQRYSRLPDIPGVGDVREPAWLPEPDEVGETSQPTPTG